MFGNVKRHDTFLATVQTSRFGWPGGVPPSMVLMADAAGGSSGSFQGYLVRPQIDWLGGAEIVGSDCG